MKLREFMASDFAIPFKMLVNPIKILRSDINGKLVGRSLCTAFISVLIASTFALAMDAELIQSEELSLVSIVSAGGLLFAVIFPLFVFALSTIVYTIGISIQNPHKKGDYSHYMRKQAVVYSSFLTATSLVNLMLFPIPQVQLFFGLLATLYFIFAMFTAYGSLKSVGMLRSCFTHGLIVFWSVVSHLIFTA